MKEKTITERIPPQAIDAEKALLGSIMFRREWMDETVVELKKEDFYYLPHQTIYTAMIELYIKNQPLDLITITGYLRDTKQLEPAGDAVYLAQIMDCFLPGANVSNYIKTIKGKAIGREILMAAHEIATKVYEQNPLDLESEELLTAAETKMLSIRRAGVNEGTQHISTIVDMVLRNIERRETEGTVSGIASGFIDIDNLVCGFQNGDLIIIAGRPSMGKSALAHDVFKYNLSIPQLLFSFEMSGEQIGKRILSSCSKLNLFKLNHGSLKNDWAQVIAIQSRLFNSLLYINDNTTITPTKIRAIARKMKREKGIKLIIVDYLQLMRGNEVKYRSKHEEIGSIAYEMKQMARELNIPVILLSQLNREVERRHPPEPILSDLRESGSIEEHADVVFLLWRPDYYNPAQQPNIACITVAKHRNGPTGKIKLWFRKELATFENLSDEEIPQEQLLPSWQE